MSSPVGGAGHFPHSRPNPFRPAHRHHDPFYWTNKLRASPLQSSSETRPGQLKNEEATRPFWRRRSTLALPRQPISPPPYWIQVKIQAMLLFPPALPLMPPSKPKPLEWCGIRLESAFAYPTSLVRLAPAESAHLFNGRRHAMQYAKLAEALDRKKEMIMVWEKEDSWVEKTRRTDLRRAESDEFHKEFLRILEWGKPICTIRPSPQELGAIKQRLHIKNSISKFPTINLFLEKYPDCSIGWAIDHFYKWQQARFIAAEELTKVKHLWEWYEACYTFQRAVRELRRKHAAPWESWFYYLRQMVERMPDEKRRKLDQFRRLKEIWQHCADGRIEFPVDICPGGMTPMVYFRLGGTVAADATTLLGSRTRAMGPQVLDEIAVMMAYDTPEEYYTNVGKGYLGATDKVTGNSSETSSVSFDGCTSAQPGDVETFLMPGAYPSGHFEPEARRTDAAKFHGMEDPSVVSLGRSEA